MTRTTSPQQIYSARRALAHAHLQRMTPREMAGLLFHPMVLIGADQDIDQPSPLGPSLRELIVDRGIRHLCLGAIPSPVQTSEVLARLQDIAASTGSGLPITFSTDPRHSFLQNPGATHRAQGVSQWPEPLGLGAIDDTDLVRDFARVVRDDYRAMGIRMALHPQVDLTTEPRWARQAQSFGTDPDHTSRLLAAFLEGLQGEMLDGDGVAATVKHFPGGGAQRDGEDPHFPYGREQVYPGGRFDDHLLPFRTAVDAGAAAIMPYYGMPVGLVRNGEAIEEVGFAFNRALITDLLRGELGYDGVVLSDFGLIHDAQVFGKPLPARAWGVEHLDPAGRMARLFNAGVDQLGGESDTERLLRLVETGAIAEERFLEAVERVIGLTLTLFPEGGPASAALDPAELPLREHVALGATAQSRAVTVLHDPDAMLPLAGARRVVVHDLDFTALPSDWEIADAADADLAIIRLSAPFEPRDHYFLEAGMEQGSLDFPDEVVRRVAETAAHTPVVLAVTLSRPAILTPLLEHAAVVVADFGASDRALLDALTGAVRPEGTLPFELPRSMAAVAAGLPDVPAGTADPLFPLGWNVTTAGVRA
ncbi:glycoside hydrolase family 3 protein [Microbacterium paludicola]|uniref:beta-glucosidase n=1 Tax=Microbacterium paludicola TaxID=300019 RepID=A0A4Y9FM48_9MICO|nr:glycoside hydrolase family 3 N-terminal domain-containing protein [Microbacterium paludicola]MBF0817771.1 glycoside hydrolase family 3 C-terminal domain-containing protein [Microbacterium paludicola]TFU29912.1 glycoside hydrolase family 3 protein [Microbacterium paludicola]